MFCGLESVFMGPTRSEQFINLEFARQTLKKKGSVRIGHESNSISQAALDPSGFKEPAKQGPKDKVKYLDTGTPCSP